MIKKGIFIAASLMIIGCGVKNNGNNNANNSQNTQPQVDKVEDFTPPKREEAPMDNLPPEYKPEPEPIRPVRISEALNFFQTDEINYKISTTSRGIYSDCTKPITERGITVNCTIDNGFKTIDGDFHINVKKEFPNKLTFSYIGKAYINKESLIPEHIASINCTNKTVQEVTFYEKGITPFKIELKENGCITNGLVMLPLINKYSWLNTNVFLKGIYTDDGTSNMIPFRRPDRSQVIYLESY